MWGFQTPNGWSQIQAPRYFRLETSVYVCGVAAVMLLWEWHSAASSPLLSPAVPCSQALPSWAWDFVSRNGWGFIFLPTWSYADPECNIKAQLCSSARSVEVRQVWLLCSGRKRGGKKHVKWWHKENCLKIKSLKCFSLSFSFSCFLSSFTCTLARSQIG